MEPKPMTSEELFNYLMDTIIIEEGAAKAIVDKLFLNEEGVNTLRKDEAIAVLCELGNLTKDSAEIALSGINLPLSGYHYMKLTGIIKEHRKYIDKCIRYDPMQNSLEIVDNMRYVLILHSIQNIFRIKHHADLTSDRTIFDSIDHIIKRQMETDRITYIENYLENLFK